MTTWRYTACVSSSSASRIGIRGSILRRSVEIIGTARCRGMRTAPTTNMACYPIFARGVLARLGREWPPVADLDDIAAVMRVIAAAYAISPLIAAAAPA
ncbi:MAG: hypothetical protein ACREQN_18465 [Candidatus Binataceae bacterium]